MSRVEIHDASTQALIEILENAHGVGYEKAANMSPLAWFTLPRDDAKWSAIASFREVWLYDELDQLVDIFRIMPFQELDDDRGAEATIKCEGYATVLQDDLVAAEVTWTNQTVTQILTDLLAYQTVSRVTLGTIDAALNITVSGYRVSYDNVMKACWELRNVVGGYISVDPVVDTPTSRKLNLRATVGNDIGQRVQKGFNLRAVGRATDPTEAVTKIYALGRGEGNNQQRPSTDLLTAQPATFTFVGGGSRSTLGITDTYSRYKGWTAAGAALPNGSSAGDTRTRTLKVKPTLTPPAAPAVVAGAAGTPNGTYKCQVTFVTALGETNGGAEATVVVVNQRISWTFAVGPTGTTGRKLYRTAAGGATGTEKLLTIIGDNVSTTFTDNAADGALGPAIPTTNTGLVDYSSSFEQGADERTLRSTTNGYNPTGLLSWAIDYVHADHLIADDTVATYGTIARPYTDRRFESSLELVRAARQTLDVVKQPRVSYDVRVADLARNYPTETFERLSLYDQVNVVDEAIALASKLRIVRVRYEDLGDPNSFSITVGLLDSQPTDVRLQDRARKYDTMPDGASNIWVDSFEDNLDATHPYARRIYVPPDATTINKLQLNMETKAYRYYVSSVSNTNESSHTHSTTGGTGTSTTEFTSLSGGGVGTPNPHKHDSLDGNGFITSLPSVSGAGSSHGHGSTVTPGIVETTTPSTMEVKVDGTVASATATTLTDFDITPYLTKDSQGKIVRGWHTVTFTPNGVGRIQAAIVEEVFLQSRGVVAG